MKRQAHAHARVGGMRRGRSLLQANEAEKRELKEAKQLIADLEVWLRRR